MAFSFDKKRYSAYTSYPTKRSGVIGVPLDNRRQE